MAELTVCSKCGIKVKTKKLEHHRKVCVSGRWSHKTHLQKKKELQKQAS